MSLSGNCEISNFKIPPNPLTSLTYSTHLAQRRERCWKDCVCQVHHDLRRVYLSQDHWRPGEDQEGHPRVKSPSRGLWKRQDPQKQQLLPLCEPFSPLRAFGSFPSNWVPIDLVSLCRPLFRLIFQGKYFQIEFSRGGVPDGGKISNFLLEKVCPPLFLPCR